jgi:hypothetical protein
MLRYYQDHAQQILLLNYGEQEVLEIVAVEEEVHPVHILKQIYQQFIKDKN